MDNPPEEHHDETHENGPAPAAQAPVMDVVAPPPPEAKPGSGDEQSVEHHEHVEEQHVPNQPKQPDGGVGLAITATVIIVIVLSLLATFAYLQSK